MSGHDIEQPQFPVMEIARTFIEAVETKEGKIRDRALSRLRDDMGEEGQALHSVYSYGSAYTRHGLRFLFRDDISNILKELTQQNSLVLPKKCDINNIDLFIEDLLRLNRLPPRPTSELGEPARQYDDTTRRLAEQNHVFRQQLAAELAPVLNPLIQVMAHETLEQKKELARWVNDQLEPFGLAVQCPNTGRPAKFRATTGSWLGVGRFYFETSRDGKHEKSAYSDNLPELTLIDASPPPNPELSWQQAVGPKEGRSGRRR